jgi:prevent-host-death family protein
MREREQPKTQTMTVSEARSQWSQLLSRVFRRQARVVVEKSGIPVAAIISPEDLARFNRLEAEWDEPFKALDRTREAFRDIPAGELEREVPKAVEEARTQLRAEREQAAKPA